MLRTLIILAVVACGGSSQPAATDDAGKVIELTGKVTATRDNTTRTLAVGQVVAASDSITTAADSSVVIELAHNHARWSLEGGITARVDASVAWSLPMQDQAKTVDHATSSAGRNAEREAADTGATAKRLLEADEEKKSDAKGEGDRAPQKILEDPAVANPVKRKKGIAVSRECQDNPLLEGCMDGGTATKAERKKGVKISQECLNNPLARGCDDAPEPDPEVKAAIARIALWADEMCACKDAACAKTVDARHMPWHIERDRKIPPASAKGKQIAAGSITNLQRYEACKAKLK